MTITPSLGAPRSRDSLLHYDRLPIPSFFSTMVAQLEVVLFNLFAKALCTVMTRLPDALAVTKKHAH